MTTQTKLDTVQRTTQYQQLKQLPETAEVIKQLKHNISGPNHSTDMLLVIVQCFYKPNNHKGDLI